MKEQYFFLVVYDISNDRRRTKLHTRLLDFGNPVQYSVFECLLSKDDVGTMKSAVKRIAKGKSDHVRFYEICGACQKKIEIIGRSEVSKVAKVIVV